MTEGLLRECSVMLRAPVVQDRDHAEDRCGRSQHDRPEPVLGGIDHRFPGIHALGPIMLDLMDEDHRVADDHAGMGDAAEDCDEPHRLAGRQERRDDADRRSGATLMTSASWRKLPSWTMRTVSMRAIIKRHLGDEGGIALHALLDRPADFKERARRHRLAYRIKRAGNALVHGGGFDAWHGLGLDGDGGEAAAAPDITFVEAEFELYQLAQRHRGAVFSPERRPQEPIVFRGCLFLFPTCARWECCHRRSRF